MERFDKGDCSLLLGNFNLAFRRLDALQTLEKLARTAVVECFTLLDSMHEYFHHHVDIEKYLCIIAPTQMPKRIFCKYCSTKMAFI